MIRHLLPLVALTALLMNAASLPATEPPQDLDAYIEAQMKTWKIPGVSLAIIKDGKVVVLKGYGVREVGKSEPVDENSLFCIGSTSKAFTAAAIAKLVEKRKLKWDDKVITHWPDFKLSDPWVTREIRVSDLLANHSGLSGVSEGLWYGSPYSREEVLRRLQHVPIDEGFRYQYQYRNVMFLAAGQLVPRVDGRSWDEFLKAEIFSPLGMTRTLPTDAGVDKMTNVARPHALDFSGNLQPIPFHVMDNIAPAGSIISSAKDLSNWVRMHLDLGTFNGKRILTAEQILKMHAPQTPFPWPMPGDKPLHPPQESVSYCLGWANSWYKGQRVVWHTGGIDGMAAWVGLVPEQKLGVVILTNLDDNNAYYGIFYRILDHYLASPSKTDPNTALLAEMRNRLKERDDLEKKWQDLAAKPRKTPLPAEKFAGKYTSPIYGDVEILVENGKLVYKRSPDLTADLVFEKNDPKAGVSFLGRFRTPQAQLVLGCAFLSFTVKNGAVTGFKDNLFEFARVP